jgi:hypothetical protein
MATRFFRSALYAGALIAAVYGLGLIAIKGVEILAWSTAVHGAAPTFIVFLFIVLLIVFLCINDLHE